MGTRIKSITHSPTPFVLIILSKKGSEQNTEYQVIVFALPTQYTLPASYSLTFGGSSPGGSFPGVNCAAIQLSMASSLDISAIVTKFKVHSA